MKCRTFNVIPRKASAVAGPSIFPGAMGMPHSLQKERNHCSWCAVSLCEWEIMRKSSRTCVM